MSNVRRLDYRHHPGISIVKEEEIRGSGGVENISYGASLPQEIITDILITLPVKSLLRFRCVSKSWYKLLKTTNFAKLQLDYSLKNRTDGILIDSYKKMCCLDYDLLSSDPLSSDSSALYNKLVHIAYPLEYEKKEIVGSSNGLVCYISSKQDIIILNPFTKDYKKIRTPERLQGDDPRGYGFGYDLKIEDYKLMLYYCWNGRSRIDVYSLKLDSWKTTMDVPWEIPCKNIVFFKGIFHWLNKYYISPKKMSCFDTASGTVKHIILPEPDRFRELRVLGGCLCVVGTDFNKNIREVWGIKDYGVENTWIKMFTIDNGKLLGLQGLNFKQYFKHDGVLVYLDDYNYSAYLYDLNHEVSKEFEIDGIMPGFRTWPFFGSLISPTLVQGSAVKSKKRNFDFLFSSNR